MVCGLSASNVIHACDGDMKIRKRACASPNVHLVARCAMENEVIWQRCLQSEYERISRLY